MASPTTSTRIPAHRSMSAISAGTAVHRENDLRRLMEVPGPVVGCPTRRQGPLRLVAVVEQYRSCPRAAAGLDIVQSVANYPRTIESNGVLVARAKDQAGLRLATAARNGVFPCRAPRVVRAVVEPGELASDRDDHLLESMFHGLQSLFAEVAARDAGLVADNDEGIPRFVEQTDPASGALRQLHGVRIDVVRNVAHERSVFVDEDGRPLSSYHAAAPWAATEASGFTDR